MPMRRKEESCRSKTDRRNGQRLKSPRETMNARKRKEGLIMQTCIDKGGKSMTQEALGMVETRGLVAAIEAADQCARLQTLRW